MVKRTSWLAIALMTVAVWAGVATWNRVADAQATSPPPACCVAVVDIVKVFNDFDQTKVLNQKMSALEADLQAQDQRKTQELETQKASLKAFAPGSAEYKKANDDLNRMMVEYQVWKLTKQQEMSEGHLRWVNRTYDSVEKQVSAIAKARGLQIVVTREDLDRSVSDSKVMLKQIVSRRVIYHDPSVDISDAVLAGLNEAFAKAGGAKSVEFDK